MKKILSLLVLLVMTLTAFAKDYTGHRTVTYGYTTPTESDNAVVSITDNGDGTYNVTSPLSSMSLAVTQTIMALTPSAMLKEQQLTVLQQSTLLV